MALWKGGKHRRTWFLWLLIAAAAAPLLLLTAGLVLLSFGVWSGEQPRTLPNGHRVLTVNGDWHGIAYPGESAMVVLRKAVPCASNAVIRLIGVDGSLVFGTVRDVNRRSSVPDGYFIYDTKTRTALTYESSAKQDWQDALKQQGVPLPPPLRSPLALPFDW